MPPRKKPTELQDLALAVWAEYVGRCILRAIQIEDSEIVHRRVDLMKSEFCDCIPTMFFDEFATQVLKNISAAMDNKEPEWRYCADHCRIWLSMFVEGLTRLQPLPEIRENLRRALWWNCSGFRKLRTLHFDQRVPHDLFPDYRAPHSFVERYLRGSRSAEILTTFVRPLFAKDADLIFLAESCLNLEVVKVPFCNEVTSTGLAALKQCSKLRSIHVQHCNFGRVTCEEMQELLSTLRQVEDIAVTCRLYDSYDCSGCLKSDAIYQAAKSYHCGKYELTSFDLLALAKKFPNLTSIAIASSIIENVSVLDRFSNLSSINIRESNFDESDLITLLEVIGHNVTELVLSGEEETTMLMWNLMHHIYRCCPNMEVLELGLTQDDDGGTYVLPPFPKLKRFTFRNQNVYSVREADFCNMLDFPAIRTLEHLDCRSLEIAPAKLIAVILDANGFPRLSTIICHSSSMQHRTFVAELIKSNNLDLVIKFYPESCDMELYDY